MARASLRDDLHAVHAAADRAGAARDSPDDSAAARIAAWEEGEAVVVAPGEGDAGARSAPTRKADLARMSVGLRVVRGLLAG